MIATAIFIVWQLSELPEKPPTPMGYRHHWMTDSWMTAIVEIDEQRREIEQAENWMMMSVKWWVTPRADIGY